MDDFDYALKLQNEGKFNESIEILTKILSKSSNDKDAIFNIALNYKQLGDIENSIKFYKKLLDIYPETIEGYYNLAFLYSDKGKIEEAIECYKKVLSINPDDVETKYFMSIAQMKNKQYKEGLKYFENRLCRKSAIITQEHTYPNLMSNAKLWQGENIHDKVIYTYYEAGFGDVLMFARYLPILEKKCKQIILKAQVPLAPLFEENFPNIHVMKFFEPERKTHFDYHIPILSLPYALGLDETNMFVLKKQYLKANPNKTESYRSKFFNNNKFKIGIKWQGNTMYDWERVLDIQMFFKLFKIPNTQFYSFQTYEGSEGVKELSIPDIGKTFNDFSDTAGAIENMDLIICNDTSLAHLAGAMGKPCWILLPYLYNWRWHQDLSKCDWYNSVRLFKQPKPKDWESVFNKLFTELTKIVQ